MNHRKPSWLIVILAAAALVALFGCKDFSFFSELGVKGLLKVNPSEVTVTVSSSVTFVASGGTPPYTYEVVSGSGVIDANTGVYDAPAATTTAIIMATDSTGESGTATVSVVTTLAALTISPTSAGVSVGNSISFVATGGVSPYTFSFQTNNSGGNVTAGGVYTAGSTTGVSDTIIVTDSDSPAQTCSVPAVVSVTAAVTNVDYSITADTLPASAFTGSALSGGFTIYNGGSGTGTANISWWLFISEDGSFGGAGEHLVDSGAVTTDIPGFGSQGVTPAGNWPVDLPQGNYDLFVMISSPDDLNHANNVHAAGSFTLNVPDVDYRVLSVTNTGGAFVGGALSGEFSLDNEGSDDGTQSITWKTYVSANTSVDVGDTLVDSSTEGAMSSAEIPRTILFSGTWPSGPGSYYLLVEVSAADDEAAGNDGDNTTATGAAISVSYPDVDYEVLSVSHLSGSRAGGSVDGEFQLDNTGSDDGTASVDWSVYASTNTSIDAGDALIASGTTGFLTALQPPRTVGFSGTWPADPNAYYLVVEVSAPEDTQAGNFLNNETATAAAANVTVADVDYFASAISAAPGIAGNTLSSDFTLNNAGSDPSSATVIWNLYVSTNNTLDAGDYLAASGTAGPLGAAPSSTVINPGGATWPTTPGNYYLIVEIESSEDVAAGYDGNDIAVSASTFPVTAPQVDYIVTQVEYTGGGEKAPGQPFDGRFRYGNDGPLANDNGVRELSWTCYASLDPNLDAGDAGVASGNGLSPLDYGIESGWINFSGTWPLDYGDYYLIVKVSSLDDEQDTDNDWLESGVTTEIGVYTESEPNDEYTQLPGGPGGYDILYGDTLATPIVLRPGMSLKVEGLSIDGGNDNDTFMFNAGTANSITFTLMWNTGDDNLDIWVYEAGDPAPALSAIGGLVDLLSASILRGGAADQFNPNQDLWFNVYYNKVGGVSRPYTAIITAN